MNKLGFITEGDVVLTKCETCSKWANIMEVELSENSIQGFIRECHSCISEHRYEN